MKKFGVAKSAEEAEELSQKAQYWLLTHDGQQQLDFDNRCGKELEETMRVVGNIMEKHLAIKPLFNLTI